MLTYMLISLIISTIFILVTYENEDDCHPVVAVIADTIAVVILTVIWPLVIFYALYLAILELFEGR